VTRANLNDGQAPSHREVSDDYVPKGEHRVYEAHPADYCGDEEAG
jgi:hypothetical protein